MNNKKKIYLISPKSINNLDNFLLSLEVLFSVYASYIFAFQLRTKIPSLSLYETGKMLHDICSKYNVMFIINDYVDLAIALHNQNSCSGIHLGQDDISQKILNQIPQNMILGISCQDRIDLAKKAVNLGAHYVSFGSFFLSKTKPDAVGRPDVKILEKWKSISKIPAVAIGGINNQNCKTLISSAIIAISDYIWSCNLGPCYALKKIVMYYYPYYVTTSYNFRLG